MLFRLLLAGAALAVATGATAATPPGVTHAGAFTIRYNALAANALPPEATDSLQLPHSARQGIVNVVVTRGAGYTAPSVPSQVSGHATTGTGAAVPIRFRTITDANGTSYLGTFHVPGTDTLRFDLDVTPRGGSTRHIHFRQSFLVP